MFREGLVDPADLPITGHPEMNVNCAPVAQTEQLMLPPTIDRRDDRPANGAKTPRRQSTAQRWMEEDDARQGLARHRAAEDPRGLLDFG